MPNSFCGWRWGSGRGSKWSRWAVHQLPPPNGSESSSSHGASQTKHTDSHIQLLPNSLFLNLMETQEEKAIPAGPDVGQGAGDGRLEMRITYLLSLLPATSMLGGLLWRLTHEKSPMELPSLVTHWFVSRL